MVVVSMVLMINWWLSLPCPNSQDSILYFHYDDHISIMMITLLSWIFFFKSWQVLSFDFGVMHMSREWHTQKNLWVTIGADLVDIQNVRSFQVNHSKMTNACLSHTVICLKVQHSHLWAAAPTALLFCWSALWNSRKQQLWSSLPKYLCFLHLTQKGKICLLQNDKLLFYLPQQLNKILMSYGPCVKLLPIKKHFFCFVFFFTHEL